MTNIHFFVYICIELKIIIMGNKLNINQVIEISNSADLFETCHNCNGIEVKGSMSKSNFNGAREHDMSCTECEKRRLHTKMKKSQKNDRKKLKLQKVQEATNKLFQFEKLFGIKITCFLDYRDIDNDLYLSIVSSVKEKGYNFYDYSDVSINWGAHDIVISEVKIPKNQMDFYREIINECLDIDIDTLSLDNEVTRIHGTAGKLNRSVNSLLSLVS